MDGTGSTSDLRPWLALARCAPLTARLLRPALAAAGSAQALAATPARFLPAPLARAIEAARGDVDADLAWLAAPQRTLLTLLDPRYPPLLAAIEDAPVALWVEGDCALLARAQVAVVGSRRPTPAGRELAREWAIVLCERGLVVTSGLALGIDAAAHRGALAAGGATVAVCGTGPDRVYPETHRDLAREIAMRGALVTEFPPGTAPLPSHFPRRNRVIAGLALGTVVVEAAARSGSLITARLAAEQGREVWALPGSVRNPLAAGCHALLKQGARLATGVEDVVDDLAFSPLAAFGAQAPSASPATATLASTHSPAAGGALDKEWEMLLDALGFEPVDVDTLVERTGLPAQVVSSMLLILELQGRIEPHAGSFCRIHAPQGPESESEPQSAHASTAPS